MKFTKIESLKLVQVEDFIILKSFINAAIDDSLLRSLLTFKFKYLIFFCCSIIFHLALVKLSAIFLEVAKSGTVIPPALHLCGFV